MDNNFFKNFIAKVKPSDEIFYNFYQAVNSAKSELVHNVISTAVVLDDAWITALEKSLFFVEDIIKNPKKFIIDEDIVVEVERARRTNAKTIRHLSANSKDISRVDDDGFVMPKRVLTTQINENIAIYENRFVCTLVHRAITFVENQYQSLKGKMACYNTTNIAMNSDFDYGDAQIEYKISLAVKEPPKNQVQLDKNHQLYGRIERLRDRLQIIKNTAFIKELSLLKPIQPPIVKTNMIKMNVDYQNCYQLWLYLSSYQMVGFSVDVKDKVLPVDGDFYDDMTVLTALTLKTLLENEKIREGLYSAIEFKPEKRRNYKVKTTVDYVPVYAKSGQEASDDVINEYFFNAMKSEFVKAVQDTKNIATNEKVLRMNFDKFFRSMNKISDEMFLQVINSEKQQQSILKRTAVQIKQEQFDYQKLLYRRYQQLSKLKSENLEKALKIESRELIKLENLKLQLDKAKKKAVDSKEIAQLKKQKVKKIRSKMTAVTEKADEYKEDLLEKEEEKRLNAAERRRAKREQAKQRKELEQLAYLKEKYEQ